MYRLTDVRSCLRDRRQITTAITVRRPEPSSIASADMFAQWARR